MTTQEMYRKANERVVEAAAAATAAKKEYREAVAAKWAARSGVIEEELGLPGSIQVGAGRIRFHLIAQDAAGNALYRANVGTVAKKEWGYRIRKPDGELIHDWAWRGKPKAPEGRWESLEAEVKAAVEAAEEE